MGTIWGCHRTLLPSFLRSSSASTWTLPTDSWPLLECRRVGSCMLASNDLSFAWRDKGFLLLVGEENGSGYLGVQTWETSNINPVLVLLHCNSLNPPFSLTQLPHCSPSLTMDSLDIAGHPQKSRHTGQNISTLGDGADAWHLSPELGWADICPHLEDLT